MDSIVYTYRMRVIKNGTETAITDIRVYSPQLTDPYNNTVAKHEGYWIVPFLLDGSRWHDTPYHTYTINKHEFIPIYYDTSYGSTRIVIDQQLHHQRMPPHKLLMSASRFNFQENLSYLHPLM
jgi:hypothetical protein